MSNKTKTHWLQSPNKNYLGHWDLPNGNDLVLTIKSAGWEAVKNPITNTTESKRVIHWEEDFKPMIVNQGNAQSIVISTGVKFLEDAPGCRVKLFVGQHKDTRTKETIDCIRVRRTQELNKNEIEKRLPVLFAEKKELVKKVNPEFIDRIQEIIDNKEVLAYHQTFNYLERLK